MADHAARRPEPVLSRAAVVTALSVLGAVLVRIGLPDAAGWLADYRDVIAGVVLAVAPVVTGYLARRHVTPLSSPRSADGVELVPADPAAPDADEVLKRVAEINPPANG